MSLTDQSHPATVRTVLGELDPAELGVCDAHDHLFLRSPLLAGQELADPAAAERELRAFAALGGRALVQWTPYGMGRRRGELVRLARATGVHLVGATGLHQARHYEPEWLRSLDLAELFVADLTAAQAPAGLIKTAGEYHGLGGHARWVMTAAAEAHHATGAPIAVHHELGTGPLQVLELLCGELGVPPRSVLLGHLNRFPDARLHRKAAESGAYVVLDGPSRAHHATDHHLFDTVADLIESGHADQLLFGGDTTTAAALAEVGPTHLVSALRPRLAAEFGEELAHRVFTTNPARAFAARWRLPLRAAAESPDRP
ncbi:phosphotriesterase [Kitasatospora sp. MMS16-BH015]|uniref:phosphotriesterase family protein n=1 Tax=Kitasatospora sp. MMS16-BH015 TaxID=2018025 RepID=UPI000CA392C8|nr:phosphotriesterase [Kitasatospora sp. MMS16-BH015]AUG80944.1 phosphotriesterase [Kitasatospora sp. MMS16-BH015]